MGFFKKVGNFFKDINPVSIAVGAVDKIADTATDFLDDRNERVLDRKDAKYDYKLEKKQLKTFEKSVAYSNGIDPTASLWSGISETTASVSNGVAAYFSGGLSTLFGSGKQGQPINSDKQILLLVGAAVLLIILTKK